MSLYVIPSKPVKIFWFVWANKNTQMDVCTEEEAWVSVRNYRFN